MKYVKVNVYVTNTIKRSIKMRKLKDFFYDKNDIIIVLIILAVAAFIIYTRIEIIMEYPEELAAKSAATETSQTSETTESSAAEIAITIKDSDTISGISEKLYDAGLVTSASEFQKYVKSEKKEKSVKAGTFQIPEGSSQEEILNIITN